MCIHSCVCVCVCVCVGGWMCACVVEWVHIVISFVNSSWLANEDQLGGAQKMMERRSPSPTHQHWMYSSGLISTNQHSWGNVLQQKHTFKAPRALVWIVAYISRLRAMFVQRLSLSPSLSPLGPSVFDWHWWGRPAQVEFERGPFEHNGFWLACVTRLSEPLIERLFAKSLLVSPVWQAGDICVVTSAFSERERERERERQRERETECEKEWEIIKK